MEDQSATEVVRRLYSSIAAGDIEAAAMCLAEDAVWVLPGTGAIAGTHRGREAILRDFFAKLGPLSGGSLRAELIDVAVGERYVVAVQHATADHAGRRLDITGCQLMRVEGGHIVQVQGHYSDQAALDDFWSS